MTVTSAPSRPTVDRPDVPRGTDDTPGATRLHAAFARAGHDRRVAFVPYVVAGYPDAATSLDVALAAIDAGADVMELGLPYSDPLADGTTLQRASAVALRNGATFERSLDLLRAIHEARPDTPLVPMAYVNQALGDGDPVGRLGRLAAAGASGVILADLTPDEGAPVEAAARQAGLALVYLVTPTTPPTRRASIAACTGGFLYTVSLVGVTGARSHLPREVTHFMAQVRAVARGPVAVGFGVSRPAHVRGLARVADGVIVASALVDALGPEGRDVPRMARLAAQLARAGRWSGPQHP